MGRSTNQFTFAKVPTIQAPRSSFDRPNTHKFTMDENYLVPFFWDEILPGDAFSIKTSIFARCISAQVVPTMDNLKMDWWWFFCPNRLLWDNWEHFMGARDDVS